MNGRPGVGEAQALDVWRAKASAESHSSLRAALLCVGLIYPGPHSGPYALVRTADPTNLVRTADPTKLVRTEDPTNLVRTADPTKLVRTEDPTNLVRTADPTG
jgi:hypothetical protein